MAQRVRDPHETRYGADDAGVDVGDVRLAGMGWLAGTLAAVFLAAACSGPGSATSGSGGAPGLGGHGATTGPGGGATTGAGAGTGTPTGTGGLNGGIGTGTGMMCTPGVTQALVSDCGYPFASTHPLTNVVFNESEVLRAIVPSGGWPTATVSLYYDDEHALTLGVRSVQVKTAAGTTTTDYPVSALPGVPSSVTNPATGTNVLSGDQSGLDASLRPMWPALFITDITANPMDRSGDWQMGGVPHNPTAVFGTWKAAVRTVDKTQSPPLVSITPDADPAKNKQNLGTGANPFPTGIKDEGFGTEVRWNVSLTPGHSYRLQVMVHDGDQNKVGGDSGEACVTFCAGGMCPSEGCIPDNDGGTGDSGTPTCPSGALYCGPGGVGSEGCPDGTVCANGCCLPGIG